MGSDPIENHVETTVTFHSPASTSPSPSVKDDAVASFQPTWWIYLAISTLSVLTFMVALDATSLAVALPVCSNFELPASQRLHLFRR